MNACKWQLGFVGEFLAEKRAINVHINISAIQDETVRPPKPGKRRWNENDCSFFSLQLPLFIILNKKFEFYVYKWKFCEEANINPNYLILWEKFKSSILF